MAMKKVSGTTALCVVTLALGIAAATTTFSAVYAAVLRPLPFADPARLVLLNHTRQNARYGTVALRWSFPGAGTIRRNARAFESIATFSRASVGLSSTGDAAGLAHLQDGRSGFDGSAATFWIDAPASRYSDAQGPAIVERLLTRIR